MSVTSTPLLAKSGPVTADGSAQYVFTSFHPAGKLIRNTNALLGMGARCSPTSDPATTADADLTEEGARFVFKPDPTALASLKFILAHDTDPNDLAAGFIVRAYREQVHGTQRFVVGDVLLTGYVKSGNTAVHTGNPAVAEATAAGEVSKWADTIEVTNDYTVGTSARVMHDAADGSATLIFDFDSHVLIEIEMGLDSGDLGGESAADAATGMWSQM